MAIQIPSLTVTRAGGVLPPGVSGADTVIARNDGNVVVEVFNPTGAAVTLTLVPQATVAGGLAVSGPSVSIAAGARVWVGPLPPAIFNDTLGQAHLSDPSGALVLRALRF